MANPWARNLVSAINVMHGGRDFSVDNPGRGYAIGGIFTEVKMYLQQFFGTQSLE
ncbi:hypothetical protein [Mucilaginibacter sp.]